jgi:hypothetical protein
MLWRAMLLLITIVIVGIASPFDALATDTPVATCRGVRIVLPIAAVHESGKAPNGHGAVAACPLSEGMNGPSSDAARGP